MGRGASFEILEGVVEAVRRYARICSWAFVIAGLAIVAGGCATPTLEERLSYLELLKTRGTITDEEHAIMRRRLVETIDLAALRAPPVPTPPPEPQRESEPLATEWVVGSWTGAHLGTGSAWQQESETLVEFVQLGDHLEWRMTRRFRYLSGISVAEAAGTAVVLEDTLEMIGTYSNGRSIASDGTPLGYRLRRMGNTLEGLSTGADPLTRTLALHRVPAAAAASFAPIEPGSLVGGWTGTLVVARRSSTDMIQDNPATLRIFTEASGGLRWTLSSSYYGRELTGSGTVILSPDHVKLVGSYNVPPSPGGHYGVATGAREIPIEYTARLSGTTLRGGGSGLDHVPQSFLFERAGR